jgi:uncharacterized protein YjdB
LRKSKKLSWFMTVMFVLTTALGAFPLQASAATALSDVNGHWAQSQIETMITKGVVAGYPDNTFKPDNTITRAEFITMTNKAFSFKTTAEINYPDVNVNDWFAKEITIAKAAGYISGYPDGTMKPNSQITRQEVATIITQILQLDTTPGIGALSKFSDAASIPTWSGSAIAAMVKAGYLTGYPDGTFKALSPTTRAMAAVILTSATGGIITPPVQQKVFDKAGTYGPVSGTQTITGNITISASGVILQNTTINGDLLISETVGEGDVTLKNVTVTGTTTIKGGGKHSIEIIDSKMASITILKEIRLILSGSTSVTELIANVAAVINGDGIASVTINANGVILEFTPGKVTVAPGYSAIIQNKPVLGPPAGGGGGGGGGGGPTNIAVTGITLNQANLILNPSQTATLTAAVQPANATNSGLLWSSNRPGSATVNQSGLVTAVAKGQATITVKTVDGNFSRVCLVDVQVPVQGISLNKLNLNMIVGGTATLLPIISPADAETTVVWQSLDSSVAEVNNGLVNAVAEGTTSIVARTTDGGFTAACTVSVGTVPVAVTGVGLNFTNLTMQIGNTFNLIPFVAPANATNTNVTWQSSNTAVAEVNSIGKVTAKANGTADITVRTVDGNFPEICTVTVETPVSGVTLTQSRIENVAVGDPDQALTATVLPASATDKTLVWSSSNTAVATFTETAAGTGTVHFAGRGSAVITATTVDGGWAASCDVIVGVRLTAISLNPATSTLKVGGNTLTPQVIPTPAIATNLNATWQSDHPEIASVDAGTGVITPVAPGTATITATPVFAVAGTLPATCVVKVYNVTPGPMIKDDTIVAGKTAVSVKFTIIGPAIATNEIVVALNDGTVLQYGSDAAGLYTYTGVTNTIKAGITSATVTLRNTVSFTINF